ncbi:hypothetical protein SG26_20495 (plasmid) [Haloarcula sp. CBA1115]|uniref:hypothetical protein n=1 Tax=Haloarcula sp. CBA1115 TaxID=1592728 RepID=UPI00059555AD|nr:hypothetical protein [Haloarcula sp. CBA1115]AJF28130.1 hypothetical protein SG26_20495 [Haloarcula sp. CBA1115]
MDWKILFQIACIASRLVSINVPIGESSTDEEDDSDGDDEEPPKGGGVVIDWGDCSDQAYQGQRNR